MHIQHFEIILYVSDLQKSRQFYSSLLEQLPSLDVTGITEFTLANNLKLGLMPEDGIAKILSNSMPHPKAGKGIPRCELYLMVDNVQQIFEKAVGLGAVVISLPALRDWGDIVAYVADADGHVIAFAKKAG